MYRAYIARMNPYHIILHGLPHHDPWWSVPAQKSAGARRAAVLICWPAWDAPDNLVFSVKRFLIRPMVNPVTIDLRPWLLNKRMLSGRRIPTQKTSLWWCVFVGSQISIAVLRKKCLFSDHVNDVDKTAPKTQGIKSWSDSRKRPNNIKMMS